MKKLIPVLIITALITTFANFHHPITPVYLNDISLSKALYGFLFGFMALGAAIASPFAGKIIDKYGTKMPLFFGLILYSISQTLFGYFKDISLLFAVRFTAGIAVAFIFPLLVSYVSKVTNKEERTWAMSRYMLVHLLMTSVGYQLGGILNIYTSAESIFFYQGIIFIVIAFITLFMKNIKIPYEKKERFAFKNIGRDLFVLFILGFISTLTMQAVIRYLDVYIIDLGYSAAMLGTFVLVTGFVAVFANFVVLPRVYKYLPDRRTLRYILLFSGITIAITFYFFELWLGLYTVFLLYVLARSMFEPLHNSIISKKTTKHHGQLIGISESFKTAGMFLGPIVGGLIYALNPTSVFYTMSIILVIGFFIGRFLVGQK